MSNDVLYVYRLHDVFEIIMMACCQAVDSYVCIEDAENVHYLVCDKAATDPVDPDTYPDLLTTLIKYSRSGSVKKIFC